MSAKLTGMDVLRRYEEDYMFYYLGTPLIDVNQLNLDGDRPLHTACWRGRFDEVLALLEGGADLNALGEDKDTPLHSAVNKGVIDIVKLLLERGSSQKSINNFGYTALDIALNNGREDIVSLLREWE